MRCTIAQVQSSLYIHFYKWKLNPRSIIKTCTFNKVFKYLCLNTSLSLKRSLEEMEDNFWLRFDNSSSIEAWFWFIWSEVENFWDCIKISILIHLVFAVMTISTTRVPAVSSSSTSLWITGFQERILHPLFPWWKPGKQSKSPPSWRDFYQKEIFLNFFSPGQQEPFQDPWTFIMTYFQVMLYFSS